MGTYDKGEQHGDKKSKQSLQREVLQESLCQYTSDTLDHIATVREFCLSLSKWKCKRTEEKTMMKDIKERADGIDLSFDHVTKSQERGKALGEYLKNKMTLNKHRRREELEKELAVVLKDTIEGLEKLDKFADAVETLAVTSLHVFVEKNQVLQLPEGTSFNSVQAVITAAIQVCPLLLQFKREAGSFFSPSLHNVEVHSAYLDKYICITQDICDMMEKSAVREFWKMSSTKTVVQLPVDLSDVDILDMLNHIKLLTDIRMDQHFRVGFLFQDDSSSGFIKEFSERQTGMLQFLTELEESAVKLDRMKKGAQISSVAGSSVGAIGGVLSIVGLALIPVTAGVSLALTLTGVGLGVTSGINSAVTTGTEIAVNNTQQKRANEVFHNFMEDVKSIQEYLEEVSKANTTMPEDNVVLGVGNVVRKVALVGNSIDSIIDCAKGGGKLLFREVAIVANALFIGLDIMFICLDSLNLAKGSQSELSQFIRARASLWRSELDSWKKIHDSLCEGMLTSTEKKVNLELPFYEKKREIKIFKEQILPSDPMGKKGKKAHCIIQ